MIILILIAYVAVCLFFWVGPARLFKFLIVALAMHIVAEWYVKERNARRDHD